MPSINMSKTMSEPELSNLKAVNEQNEDGEFDAVDGKKNGYERLEMSKERSGSFPILRRRNGSVTFQRIKQNKEIVSDGVPQNPKRKQRRIIAIESTV